MKKLGATHYLGAGLGVVLGGAIIATVTALVPSAAYSPIDDMRASRATLETLSPETLANTRPVEASLAPDIGIDTIEKEVSAEVAVASKVYRTAMIDGERLVKTMRKASAFSPEGSNDYLLAPQALETTEQSHRFQSLEFATIEADRFRALLMAPDPARFASAPAPDPERFGEAPTVVASLDAGIPMFREDALAIAPAEPEPAPPAAAKADPAPAPVSKPEPEPKAVAKADPAPPTRRVTSYSIPSGRDKNPVPGVALAYAAPGDDDDGGSRGAFSGFNKLLNVSKLPGPGSGVAVYDIKNSVVYMPNGQRLEAHSGLGKMKDNPTYAHVRMKGPTPPNVYNLRMREALFHGVEAVRMLPVDHGRMRGRDGILAHTYMLRGTNGSNGCLSFKHYDKFLAAFKRGEVKKIVVVPDMSHLPTYMAML